MKKGTFVGIVALVVAAIGVIIALAAYFKNKTSYLYDEDDFLFDDPDDLDYMFEEDDLSPDDEYIIEFDTDHEVPDDQGIEIDLEDEEQ